MKKNRPRNHPPRRKKIRKRVDKPFPPKLETKPKTETKGGLDRRELTKYVLITAGLLATGGVAYVLNENKEKQEIQEKLEKIVLPRIKEYIVWIYNEKKTYSKEDGINRRNSICKEILDLLNENGIKIDRNSKLLVIDIINFFEEHGYIFAIEIVPISSNRFELNAPCFKMGETSSHDLSKFNLIEGFPEISDKVDVIEVAEVIIPDIRETRFHQGRRMMFDGMTVTDIEGGSRVLIFPEKIAKVAKRKNLDPDDYRKTVEMNELSQVYFSKIVPTVLLSVSLQKLGISTNGKDWDLGHVNEAFSDLASLELGNNFEFEFIRIYNSKLYQYDLSTALLKASLELFLSKNQMQAESTIQKTFEVIEQKGLMNELKGVVIRSYKKNIQLIISKTIETLKKLSK